MEHAASSLSVDKLATWLLRFALRQALWTERKGGSRMTLCRVGDGGDVILRHLAEFPTRLPKFHAQPLGPARLLEGL